MRNTPLNVGNNYQKKTLINNSIDNNSTETNSCTNHKQF